MRHLVLDTNVLLDILGNRQPHAAAAIVLLQRAEAGTLRLSASALGWTTAFYVLRKLLTPARARRVLRDLHRHVDILDDPAAAVAEALEAGGESDFEDAVQWRIAARHGADAFLTRDRRGFRCAGLPVLSPAEWLAGETG
jgi:predicted nucleic acid-binding protein